MTKKPPRIERLELRHWWMLRFSLIWAYRGTPGSRVQTQITFEPTLTAWWIEHGRVRIGTPAGAKVARRGQWLMSHGRDSQSFSKDARILSVNFRAHWPDGRPLVDLPAPVVLDAADHGALGRAGLALVRTCPKPPKIRDRGWLLYEVESTLPGFFRLQSRFDRFVEAWTQAMLAAGGALTRSGGIDPRTAHAMRRIETAATGTPLDHQQIAEGLGIGPSQLSRLFVQDLGMPPRAYELKHRLRAARQLLASPDKPIKQVAYQLGFKQPSHFSAWFKRGTGSTPRAFRERPEHPNDAIT